jgi:hypothetical protein
MSAPRAAGPLLALVLAATGCGFSAGDVSLPKCEWIAVDDVSGSWVSGSFDGRVVSPNTPPLESQTWILQQDEAGGIAGTYVETYIDDSTWSGDLTGLLDPTGGLLELTFDSPIYGTRTRLYRFASEVEMYDVSSDPARDTCFHPIRRLG